MSFDCVVIGGGAAGMMAAIQCKKNNMQTVIVEHTAKLGTKILKTGNGKCNFSNTFMDKEMYQNNNADYAMNIINRFNVDDTIYFFEDLSVYKKERNGYLYPRSEMAASVALALTGKIQELDIPVYFETGVKRIDRAADEYVLRLEGAKTNTIKTKTVILACGSAASPSSGSDGSGYKLVKKLGIKVVKPLPALTALESDKKNMKLAAGVRAFGNVKIMAAGREISQDTGEIQFTDYGISGIPVFQVSRFAVRALDSGMKVEAYVDVAADIKENELVSMIKDAVSTRKHQSVSESLSGIFNKKLVMMICKDIGIEGNSSASGVNDDICQKLARQMKSLCYNITGYKGNDYAQVCQGGVDVSELNGNLESVNNPGIFFAGEITDIDGRCGGYNLQWAWSSGAVAAAAAYEYCNG